MKNIIIYVFLCNNVRMIRPYSRRTRWTGHPEKVKYKCDQRTSKEEANWEIRVMVCLDVGRLLSWRRNLNCYGNMSVKARH